MRRHGNELEIVAPLCPQPSTTSSGARSTREIRAIGRSRNLRQRARPGVDEPLEEPAPDVAGENMVQDARTTSEWMGMALEIHEMMPSDVCNVSIGICVSVL